MKKIAALILTFNLFCMIPCRVQAQETRDEWLQIYENIKKVKEIYKVVDPYAKKFNDHLSRIHSVKIDALNFESQYQRLYPRSYKYAQDQIRRERGLVNIAMPAMTSTGKPFAVETILAILGVSLGYMALVLTETQIIMVWDDRREGYCREDLMAGGATSLGADQECNYQSDQWFAARAALGYLIPIPGTLPAVYLAQLLEFLMESGRRYPLHVYVFGRPRMGGREPINQYKPPSSSIFVRCAENGAYSDTFVTNEIPEGQQPNPDDAGLFGTVTVIDGCPLSHGKP